MPEEMFTTVRRGYDPAEVERAVDVAAVQRREEAHVRQRREGGGGLHRRGDRLGERRVDEVPRLAGARGCVPRVGQRSRGRALAGRRDDDEVALQPRGVQ